MTLSKKASILALCLFGAGASGFVGTRHVAPLLSGAESEADAAGGLFAAGQFSIPVFEDGNVRFVLLAQVEVETSTFEQSRQLGRNRARVRSTMIDTFYELEKSGAFVPGGIDPKGITTALQRDLEAELGSGPLKGVLINRLLLQEMGRSRSVS